MRYQASASGDDSTCLRPLSDLPLRERERERERERPRFRLLVPRCIPNAGQRKFRGITRGTHEDIILMTSSALLAVFTKEYTVNAEYDHVVHSVREIIPLSRSLLDFLGYRVSFHRIKNRGLSSK